LNSPTSLILRRSNGYKGWRPLRAIEIARKEFPKASPETPVLDAMREIVEYEYGAVLVLDEEGKLDGILTERDIIRAIAQGKDLMQLKVKDIMKRTTVVAHKDLPIRIVLQLFGAYKVRRIPVVDDEGRVLGVISSTDAVYEALPKVLHPLAARVEQALEEAPEVDDNVASAAKLFAKEKIDAAWASSKLISERSIIKALLEGKRPSEFAENVVEVFPELSLRDVALLMKLNRIRFVTYGKKYAFTRGIAVAAAERAEYTIKAYTLVKVKPGYEKAVREDLSKIEEIVNIEMCTGPYDFVATALLGPNMDDVIPTYLRSKEYVLDTLTLIVLPERQKEGESK